MRPDKLTFAQLRDANERRRVILYPRCADWLANDWAVALAGEVGELCNLLKKIRRGDDIPGTSAKTGNEIADIQTYLDILASALGHDLGRVTRKKFNAVSRKYKVDVKL